MTVETIAPVDEAERRRRSLASDLESITLSLSSLKQVVQGLAGSDMYGEGAQGSFFSIAETLDGICRRLAEHAPDGLQY